jgi:cytochrome c oxidase subunit 3
MPYFKPTRYEFDPGGGALAQVTPAHIALRVLMLVITAVFGLLALAFLMRSQFPDWQGLADQPWMPLADPWRLWINTALLAASSVALQWARVAARRGERRATAWGLGAGGLLAFAFIGGQLGAWNDLAARGFFVASNPANSFFYLITGLHGAHLIGGLIAWARAALRLARGADLARVRTTVELCTSYWHFLFVVWLAMFALITRPQETLAALAAICGLR